MLKEYLEKISNNNIDLENELRRLISEYNDIRKTNLIVYVSNFNPQVPSHLESHDYYYLKDLLEEIPRDNLDIYLETPGGCTETAEDIVKYIHNEFKKISFVICGEAKSAGTIMTMSGNEILMTKTGSLGPIDAQINTPNGFISAYDYIDWYEEKKKEKNINKVDEIIINKINPGELNSIKNGLDYCEELVYNWLIKYQNYSKEKANKISKELINHKKWHTHNRSLKIDDLEDIGLNITKLESNKELEILVYKINLVCRLLLNMSKAYKIFSTNTITISLKTEQNIKEIPDLIDINHKCPICGKEVTFYAKLKNTNQNISNKLKIPDDNLYKCTCGQVFDLTEVLNNIEHDFNTKIIK